MNSNNISIDLICGRPRLPSPGSSGEPPVGKAAEAEQVARYLSQGQEPRLLDISGPFSMAWRDQPDGPLALAVDRFARETMCHAQRNGRTVASPRADRLADPGTPLDPQAMFHYLFFHAIPSPLTIFKGVSRLPPGHLLRESAGPPQPSPFWTAAFDPPVSRPSLDAAKAEFLRLLEAATADELDDGKPGCFLSGGTDSSTVAGMLAKVAGRKVSTFSIGFDAKGYDEMAFARITARHFGTDHHEYYVTPDDLVRSIPRVAASFDQPFGNSSVVPAYFCAAQAREAGVTRMLAGDGGDELFGGNSRYAKQRIFDAYELVPSSIRRGIIEPFAPGAATSRIPLLRKASSYVEQARLPMPERTHLYNLLLRIGIEEVLEPEFLHRVDVHAPGREQRQVWEAARATNPIDRTLAFDWRYTLAESDLPKVRQATSLAGVEVGYPMLAEALVEFSCRLPPEWKLKGLKLRWFFKEALRGFLPDETLAKRKQGFGLPFGVWATEHAALRELAVDSVRSLGTRGVIRPAFIESLVRDRLYEHPGYYGEMVWILMMLEQWLRHHRPDYRVSDG